MLIRKSALTLVVLGVVISVGIHETMAQQTQAPAQSGTSGMQTYMQPNNSGYLRSSQILGIPTSHCGHVIDLMMSNRMRQRSGQHGTEQLHLPHLTVGLTPGDLELLCVHLVCDGDAARGPVFQIDMKNNSSVPIGNFKVSVVGVLGQIDVHSPTADICVPRMEAGEQTQVQIQLPVTCMTMGYGIRHAPFDTLIVALDSHDILLECNELNNVRILKRCDIGSLVTETVSAVPAQPAPDSAVPVAPAPESPQDKDGSPLDGLDLDSLELDEGKNLRARLR